MLTPEQLFNRLAKIYPLDATKWAQASDEVRDMCRDARLTLGLSEECAIDFRHIKTPAEWNIKAINGIYVFYSKMSSFEQYEFCKRWSVYCIDKKRHESKNKSILETT